MKRTNLLHLIFCLFLLPSITQANHLIGGDASCACLSSGSYELTFRILRDCDGAGAEFDDPMVCTIYRGNAAPYVTVANLNVDLTLPVNQASTTLDDCLGQTLDCLERGEYNFTQDLPVSTESYHFVYQRCCNAGELDNLVDTFPGFSIVFELTPEAQVVCDNSPIMSDHSFFEVCKGEPFEFNVTAFDDDGDQMMYEWCTPILGGGDMGTPSNPGDPKACDGVAPDPACPPPFETVTFLPGFTAEQPLGTASSIQLNPNTGDLVGVAETPGLYITALCVSEFRNNVLLSRQLMNVRFLVHNTINTNEIGTPHLVIYPNPASEEAIIVLPKEIGEYEVFVRDVAGRLVMRQRSLTGVAMRLSLVDWKAGMYWLELRKGEERHFGKLIVRNKLE